VMLSDIARANSIYSGGVASCTAIHRKPTRYYAKHEVQMQL
jgi:hypothetical protein